MIYKVEFIVIIDVFVDSIIKSKSSEFRYT